MQLIFLLFIPFISSAFALVSNSNASYRQSSENDPSGSQAQQKQV
jgi:hypothetical protein